MASICWGCFHYNLGLYLEKTTFAYANKCYLLAGLNCQQFAQESMWIPMKAIHENPLILNVFVCNILWCILVVFFTSLITHYTIKVDS